MATEIKTGKRKATVTIESLLTLRAAAAAFMPQVTHVEEAARSGDLYRMEQALRVVLLQIEEELL